MTEVEQQEFIGEVYWDGDAFMGRWSVRAGNRVLGQGRSNPSTRTALGTMSALRPVSAGSAGKAN
jgi:hypothetical protein